jgi:carbon storage regulator
MEEFLMLVLTRRIGEEIVIDGNIRVVVTAIQGQKVRLGITAPPSIPVDRKEVHDRRAEFEFECEWAQPMAR